MKTKKTENMIHNEEKNLAIKIPRTDMTFRISR